MTAIVHMKRGYLCDIKNAVVFKFTNVWKGEYEAFKFYQL